MNEYEAPQESIALPAIEDGRARDRFWALFLAVVSVVFCAPLTAPYSLFRASRLLKHGSDGYAVTAIVIAAFGLATSLLLWILVIWQFLTPSDRVPR